MSFSLLTCLCAAKFAIISNFLYCCIKNGSQNIYNHLYKYFKVGEKGIYTDDEMNVANILIGMN